MVNPIVFVALDYKGPDKFEKSMFFAEELSRDISSRNYGFKVNLDHIVDLRSTLVRPYDYLKYLITLGKPIFVDPKMENGGSTMVDIAQALSDLNVHMFNMYSSNGTFMKKVSTALEMSDTKLFGLTVYTKYTDETTLRLYGRTVGKTVRMFAEIAQENGADGIILPGTHLDAVEDIDLLKLCPGIRPEWYAEKGEQKQIVTPRQAISDGADYLVIGSPIRKPIEGMTSVEALEKVLEEIGV